MGVEYKIGKYRTRRIGAFTPAPAIYGGSERAIVLTEVFLRRPMHRRLRTTVYPKK